ncbi:hypothetical protein [Kordia sp.]|uniref:hypothetical protein n=1 Tax=Kordia sp. TaxID=1965332 RepID=UPI003B593B05
MNKSGTLCKELSVESYLSILKENDIIKDKLEELGIVLDKNGLSVPLNYTDLLTEKEKAFLKELADKFNAKYEGDTEWHVKFGSEPGARRYCYSDVICEHCYQSLIDVRNHENYMK